MSLSIGEHVTAPHHWVARLWPLLRALMKSLLDGWDVLIWYIVTDCGVLEDAAEVGVIVVNLFICWL